MDYLHVQADNPWYNYYLYISFTDIYVGKTCPGRIFNVANMSLNAIRENINSRENFRIGIIPDILGKYTMMYKIAKASYCVLFGRSPWVVRFSTLV